WLLSCARELFRELAGALGTLLRIDRQASIDDGGDRRRNARDRRERARPARGHLPDEVGGGGGLVGELSRRREEEGRAHRVPIGAPIDVVRVRGLLGREEIRRGAVEALRDAEVEHL